MSPRVIVFKSVVRCIVNVNQAPNSLVEKDFPLPLNQEEQVVSYWLKNGTLPQ